MGIKCEGRQWIPGIGELSPSVLRACRAKMDGKTIIQSKPRDESADLPSRPPALCPGCPHRAVFSCLGRYDVVVTGDIGCYSLGVLPPLSRIDTILCMGGGISMAHGMDKAGTGKTLMGESTTAASIEEFGRACGIKPHIQVRRNKRQNPPAVCGFEYKGF